MGDPWHTSTCRGSSYRMPRCLGYGSWSHSSLGSRSGSYRAVKSTAISRKYNCYAIFLVTYYIHLYLGSHGTLLGTFIKILSNPVPGSGSGPFYTGSSTLVFAINRISACNITSSICLLRRVRLHTWARTTLRHSPSLRSPQSDI